MEIQFTWRWGKNLHAVRFVLFARAWNITKQRRSIDLAVKTMLDSRFERYIGFQFYDGKPHFMNRAAGWIEEVAA